MQIATAPDSTREEVIQCAIAAAPYCHAKLKQIDVTLVPPPRDPKDIEREINHLIAGFQRAAATNAVTTAAAARLDAPARQRDLVGVAE
jgi:hypothetical protein